MRKKMNVVAILLIFLVCKFSYAQSILDNTTWRGVDNERDLQITFLPNGIGRYTSHNGAQFVTYENMKWSLNGSDLYMEINNKFVEKNAKIIGGKFSGNAVNKPGKTWAFEYSKIDLNSAPSFEQVARKFNLQTGKSEGAPSPIPTPTTPTTSNSQASKAPSIREIPVPLATNAPAWGNAAEVNFRGQGSAIENIEVSLFVDTQFKGSTKQPFATRLLLGEARGGFILIIDNSALNNTNSILMDVVIDCKKDQVRQIKAAAYADEIGKGKFLDVINGDVFGIFTLKTTKVQGVADAKQMALKYYCGQAERQEKKEEEAEARRRFLETPEGKKFLADEAAKEKKAEQDRIKVEAAEKARIAKEFPYYAVISCGIGTGHMTITACFSGDYGSLEIRNGNDYGLYKIVQIANRMIPNAKEQRDGLVVDLRSNFEINARNGESKNIILGVKIVQRNTGNVLFQKQVDNFGSVKVRY
jgi:hypothetical protein